MIEPQFSNNFFQNFKAKRNLFKPFCKLFEHVLGVNGVSYTAALKKEFFWTVSNRQRRNRSGSLAYSPHFYTIRILALSF